MPQLPRALIVDDDPAFVQSVTSCLRDAGNEIAVRVEWGVDGALRALDEHRPHIMFLNWAIGGAGPRPGEILGRMSSLMELDPSNYDYPILINTGWRPEFQGDWDDQGITFKMENPWTVLERAQYSEWGPEVVRLWISGRKMRALRTLKLLNGAIDLARCVYLRISDSPPLLLARLAGEATSYELRRHRAETFDVISEQIVIPRAEADALRTLPALFVKSNMRNTLVNLAHVKHVGYDEDGDFALIFQDTAIAPIKLSKNVSHVVNQRLEMLRQWKCWPHLEHVCLPD
jgi:DNA-binding NarL/FixJ family response regulator